MFNKSQIEAISHNRGPAIVLAGPGSGKTLVITHRIKKLIEDYHVPPEDILVVTFTKAAAINMRERFLRIINKKNQIPVKYGVTFGTFHSIFYKILKVSHDYKNEDIVSERQKFDYIKEIAIRIHADTGVIQEFVSVAAGEISKIKGNMLDIGIFNSACCETDKFRELYQEYEQTLKAEKKIDFDDILLKCYELLNERDEIRAIWQRRYRYILIDEFQDINKIQYEVIKLLAQPENNIFIVGDDDQSIYGFRGADPKNMFQFKKDYKDAKEILLNINYRSSPEIVKLSHHLIENNKLRFEKDIVSAKMSGEIPDIRQFKNQGEELEFLSRQIKKYIRGGIRADEMVILVRNNSQIFYIKEFLKNEMITICRDKDAGEVYNTMAARDVLSYIRAAINIECVKFKDNSDLIYILNKPARFISRQVIGREGMNFEQLKRVYSHSAEVMRNIEDLQFHMKMIRDLSPRAAITYIRYGAGYEKYLQQYAMEKRVSLKGLLKQLDNIQNEALHFATIKEWLSVADNNTENQYKNNGNNEKQNKGINIMTMHGAKGLEYRVVFIVEANQGIVPSSKAVRENNYEEERRVFYVAITRAAEKLHVYGVKESLGCPVEMSMFVEEILSKEK